MSILRQFRRIVKSVAPYAVEARYIRRRYGRADFADMIGELGLPFLTRLFLNVLPYGLSKAWLMRRICPLDWRAHQAKFPAIVARMTAKVRAGGRLDVLFLVSDTAMFAAEPLFVAMSDDSRFAARIAVIPDFRRPQDAIAPEMDRCAEELRRKYADARVARLRPDDDGCWPDVVKDADLVCYPLPYDFSHWRYSIRYSSSRDILPVHVNYGFYRSLYDRKVMQLENYARFWRVFLECDQTMREYAAYSLTHGVNAVLTGYVKMDALADVRPVARKRKRILVALHHSVSGGKNDELALATVTDRADCLRKLPAAYPHVDFVIRPHPFLIQTLSQQNVWGPAKTDAFVRQLRSMPNVVWSEGGSYLGLFADSDACIQDCGSYLVEYLYTGKPCCYMLRSPADIDAKFAPLGKACLEQCSLAYDASDITAFIERVVLGGEDSKAVSRDAFARTVMVNYPNAARAALASLVSAFAGAS